MYYNYTAYLLDLEKAVDGTDENGNPCKLITRKSRGSGRPPSRLWE